MATLVPIKQDNALYAITGGYGMEKYDDGTPIVPLIPIWAKDGNKKLHTATVNFVDRNGNHALIEEIVFEDKKGKVHKAIARVIWD